MLIHNSHTKENLVKIIKLLDLPIKYSNLIKEEIKENFYEYFLISKMVSYKRNNLNFRNIDDLKIYLSQPSKKTQSYLCIKDRQNLIDMSRRILAFVENGCDFDKSIYKDFRELHHNIVFVCKYGGDISTCRRSIKMINETFPPDKRYEMDISDETKKILEEREIRKNLFIPKFQVKHKKESVVFS